MYHPLRLKKIIKKQKQKKTTTKKHVNMLYMYLAEFPQHNTSRKEMIRFVLKRLLNSWRYKDFASFSVVCRLKIGIFIL